MCHWPDQSSHFPKSVIFTVILVWLVHNVTKMYESQYVKCKKPTTFQCAGVKWCKELFCSWPLTFQCPLDITSHLYNYGQNVYISCTVTSGSCEHPTSYSYVSKFVPNNWITLWRGSNCCGILVHMKFLLYPQSTETSSKRMDTTKIPSVL
jgi:hypothetical protein